MRSNCLIPGALLLVLRITLTDGRTQAPEFKSDVQKIEHENEKNTRQEHGNRPKYPHEKRKREVERAQPQRPKIAAAIDVRCHIIRRHVVVLRRNRHLIGYVDQYASVTVIPDRLNIEQKSHQETHQYAEKL